ncbi:MAG TPA: glycosyltransferase family 39 protein [Candidatus Limnocylindrales bacterium]|nr:glycosyltransferase family 39 protein [Candidatus Limnocylindrales bacterium]
MAVISATRSRGALLVLGAAVLVRALAWLELSGSAVLHMERWAVTDMNFFHRWAQTVAGGDVLLRDGFLPDNTALVCAVRDHKGEWYRACDEAYVAETWNDWVGRGAYWQDPLYPYLVAAVYAGSGSSNARIVLLAQAAVGVASCLLAYAIAARLFGNTSGIAAGLVAAVLGTGVYYETLLLRSALLGFGALLCLWTMLRALALPSSPARAVLTGVCSGLFALVSTTTIGFVVLALPLCTVALRRGWLGIPRAPVLRFLAAFLVGFAVGFSPLIARNVAIGAPPLRSAVTAPLNFINGNGPGATPRSGFVRNQHAPAILAEAGWDLRAVVRATIARYDHWTDWARLVAGKLIAFWHWYELPNNFNYYYFQRHIPITSHLLLSWPVLVGLSAVGLLFGLRRSPGLLFPLAWVASTAAVCAIFFNLSRLRFPAALALTPLAGHGLALMVTWTRRLQARRLLPALVVAVAVGTATLAPWEVPFGLIRTDFYNVTNRIALELSDEALARGDKEAALTVAEKQLRSEPDSLREVPQGAELGLDAWIATAAAGFAQLYRRAAELHEEGGRAEIAAQRRARAEVLETVAREWKAAPRKPPLARPPVPPVPSGATTPAAAPPPAPPPAARPAH